MDELVKAIILPSHLAAILGVLGCCFLAVRRLRRKGTYLLIAGVSVYLVFSNGIVAAGLIGPLEYRYPALVRTDESSGGHTAVLLTSFATDDLSMPLSSRVGTSAAHRVLETLRLYADGEVTKILISGDATAASIMAELLVAAGVPNEVIAVDGGARSTIDSARRAGDYVPSSRIILITSAGHMPRSINSFRDVGIEAIPAPTDHKMPRDPFSASMMPSAYHLEVSDLAIHEYAGLLWYRVTGRSSQYW